MVIQGHVFWTQWKGNKMLASFPNASKT